MTSKIHTDLFLTIMWTCFANCCLITPSSYSLESLLMKDRANDDGRKYQDSVEIMHYKPMIPGVSSRLLYEHRFEDKLKQAPKFCVLAMQFIFIR